MAAASCAAVLSLSNNSASSTPNVLYKLKITLTDYYHKVRGGRWRRVIVPANFSLLELHVVIQLVFGWENYHLHHFMSMAKNGNPRRRQRDPVEYKIPEEYDDPILMREIKMSVFTSSLTFSVKKIPFWNTSMTSVLVGSMSSSSKEVRRRI